MTRVADASWLYALLIDTEPFHAKAKTEAQREDAVYVPPAALAETLNLIQYRIKPGHATAVRALEKLAAKQNLVLDQPPHDHEATTRVWRAHPRLSYSDAAVVAAARAKGVGLFTHDVDQEAAHRSGMP